MFWGILIVSVFLGIMTSVGRTCSKSMSAMKELVPDATTSVPWDIEEGLGSVEITSHFDDGSIQYQLVPTPAFTKFASRFFGGPVNSQVAELVVARKSFGDDELFKLSKISSLRALKLQHTQVTKQGLLDFLGSGSVLEIFIDSSNEQVTNEGLDEIERKFPSIKVHRELFPSGVIG